MKNWNPERYRDIPLNFSWIWDEEKNKFVSQNPVTGWKKIIERIMKEDEEMEK